MQCFKCFISAVVPSWTPLGSYIVLPQNQGRRNGCEAGGYNFAGCAREKIFLTPHLWLTWGDMKQDIAVFFTAFMTSDL